MALYKLIYSSGSQVKYIEGTTLMDAASKIGLYGSGLNKTWSGSITAGVPSVPGVVTSIDLSRASVASQLPPPTGAERFAPIGTSRASIPSELPPPTGKERFVPIVSPTKTGTGTAPSGPSITPSGTTLKMDIPITTTELQRIEAAKAKGLCVGAMKSYYTVKTYKVALKTGDHIYVEALDQKTAKDKALAAGYKVAWVTRYFGFGISTPTKTATSTGGTAMGTTPSLISEWTVTFERGSPITVEATSEAQAIAIAQNRQGRVWGLALSATKGSLVSISSKEAADRIIKAYNKGNLDGVEALCTYGGLLTHQQIKTLFGEVVDMPDSGSVAINTNEGIMLITGDYAKLLRDTKYYKESTASSDASRLGTAHTSIQQDYERWAAAIPILEKAGLTKDEDYTIENLSRFARNTTNGLQVLKDCGFAEETVNSVRDFNETATRVITHIGEGLANKTLTTGEKQALARIYEGIGQGLSIQNLYEAGAFDEKAYNMLKARFGEQALKADPTTLEAGIVPEFLKAIWDKADDDTKVTIAFAFDQDYSKGSSFASVIKSMEYESMKGPWQMTALAIPVSMLSPVGKQITLDEAKKQLNKQYQTELSQFADYVKKDGDYQSFDLDKIKAKLDSDNKFTADTLKETGYDSKTQLIQNLEYYNYGTRVDPKEWAVAGLVGGLTVLSLGGGTVLGSIGTGGKIAASFLGNAMPVTLGALCLPDTVKVVKDPNSPTWLKALATGGTALMFAPLLGPTIRGVQFIKIASKNDYVPLRSMSREVSTYRVEFTPNDMTKMSKAGYKEADIINLGNEINRRILAGEKIAFVDVLGTDIRIKVKSVPYQELAGPALFNSTPDGSLLARGTESQPIFRTFFTEGKVAIEPLQRSYLTGQRATRPTINEIRITDPELIAQLFPQKRLIGGGKVIEPEAAIPSLDELAGMGYRLEPIPGAAGKGVTFDATLGKVEIRRYTLAKVVEHPTGLAQVKLSGTGDGGVVAIGDLHGTAKYTTIFDGVNSGYAEPLIKGDPKNPKTWEWNQTKAKGRTVVNMGDLIDRGPAYDTLRQTFNRLADQARANDGRVVRLLGNHELAYISGDVIKGGGPRGFPEIIPDKVRASIKANILSDIKNGYMVAAFAKDGKLFTHAGVSKGVFPEFASKTPEYVASALNKQFTKSVKYHDFTGKMFARGRTEWSSAASPNEKAQGGIFWLRPQEATVKQLDLGFTQVVGHNPGFEVREIWGPDFIETDVGALRTGKVGAYIDTPYITTKSTPIVTEVLGGKAPQITGRLQTKLIAGAMRDTVADVFLGWDGRIQAIQKLRQNDVAVKALLKEINAEIKIRQKAGDKTGIKLLNRMKMELTSPEGRDYVYGGIDFWRDIVMGRQNSVKVIEGALNLKAPQLNTAIVAIGSARNNLGRFSSTDTERLFGMSRNEILARLDTSKINKANLEAYQQDVARLSQNMVDIVDTGLERNFVDLLDKQKLVNEYTRRLQDRATDTYRTERNYEPRTFDDRAYEERLNRARDVIDREVGRELNERITDYYRQVRSVRQPRTPRGVRSPRTPRAPRTPRTPTASRTPAPPYGEYVPRVTPTYPYPPYPPIEPKQPRAPVPPTPPYPPSPPIKTTMIALKGKPIVRREGPALAVWKQGLYWVSIFPPFRTTGTKPDVVYSRNKPQYAGAIAKGRHAPRKTLRAFGTIPPMIELPMGVTTARIKHGRELVFSRRRVNGRKRRSRR